MFRRTALRFVAFGALLLAAALGAFGQDPSGWQEYSYPEHGFAVKAPSKLEFQWAGAWELRFPAPDEDHWLILRVDTPTAGENENASLDNLIAIMQRNRRGWFRDLKVVDATATVGQHPCRMIDYWFRPDGLPGTVHVRSFICIANGHEYEIRAGVDRAGDYPARMAAVVNSFRILDPGAPASPQPAAESEAPKAVPAPPAKGSIRLNAKPAHAQAYLDGRFAGMTGDDGVLLIDAEPGRHQLRISSLQYQDWKNEVTITGGEVTSVEATLERSGPKPLRYSDVEEALSGSIPSARVIGMVKEYGVDFDLTDEREAHLRSLGADDKLIIAIMKNKK